MKTYWTFYRPHFALEGVQCGLGRGEFSSPGAVHRFLRNDRRWKVSDFRKEAISYARVEVADAGFQVTFYPSLAAARRVLRQTLIPNRPV